MSDYTEGSMGAIVCVTGIIPTDKIYWHTCKITLLAWTNHFLEGLCTARAVVSFPSSSHGR